jgi:uncharacterized protein (TIGR02246 family)
MVRTWNAGDALAFAGYFAEDADLVNIHGMHLRGRQAIAGLFEMLFRSVFAKARVSGVVSSTRTLRKAVALVHLKFAIDAPAGNWRGNRDAVSSVVLVHDTATWRVASMHNTLVTSAT